MAVLVYHSQKFSSCGRSVHSRVARVLLLAPPDLLLAAALKTGSHVEVVVVSSLFAATLGEKLSH